MTTCAAVEIGMSKFITALHHLWIISTVPWAVNQVVTSRGGRNLRTSVSHRHRLRLGGQPVFKACRSKARIWPRRKALIVYLDSVIACLSVRSHLTLVVVCLEELANEFVHADLLGTGDLNHAATRFVKCHVGHCRCNVICRNRLHHCGRQPNCLPVSR